MQREFYQKQTVPGLGIRQQGQAVCRGNISKTWWQQELGHETRSSPQNQGLVSRRGICYGPVFEVYLAELWFHAMVSTAQLDEHWRVTDLTTHFICKVLAEIQGILWITGNRVERIFIWTKQGKQYKQDHVILLSALKDI